MSVFTTRHLGCSSARRCSHVSHDMKKNVRREWLVKLGVAVALLLFVLPFYFEHNHAVSTRSYVVRGDDGGQEIAVFMEGVLGNYDYDKPEFHTNRTGPGEYGKPVETNASEMNDVKVSIQLMGYNMISSDKIAVDRIVPDTRIKECLYWQYPTYLPSASVVIVFYNEGWSTLLRTVHSVINTSPRHLLKEVILIDDHSDQEHLQHKLDDYVDQFGGLVTLYRNDERRGVMRSREKGGILASGEVLVFIESHCECNRNWLPPLLTRISNNRTVMAVPIIDLIQGRDFAYRKTEESRGIFDWSLAYTATYVPYNEAGTRKYNSMPYRSPTHSGGIFAIDKTFFFELGGYDPGMKLWGGENIELSFKIWMCGGSIEWVPCSRVGHIYDVGGVTRRGFVGEAKLSAKTMNTIRVVEVWFDDIHKEYFYRMQPWLRGTPIPDIPPRKTYRGQTMCKSFKWFMDNVAYDVIENHPIPKPNLQWGQIILHLTDHCWTPSDSLKIMLTACQSRPHKPAQFYRLDTNGDLSTEEGCVQTQGKDKTIYCQSCADVHKEHWKYIKDTKQIRSAKADLCAEFNGTSRYIVMKKCDEMSMNQKWSFNQVYMWA